MMNKKIDIVVIGYNPNLHLLKKCVMSIIDDVDNVFELYSII